MELKPVGTTRQRTIRMTATQRTDGHASERNQPMPLRTIVVATDFSEYSAEALTWASPRLPAAIPKSCSFMPSTWNWLRWLKRGCLSIMCTTSSSGCYLHRIKGRIVFSPGKAWEVIGNVAKLANADLIVIGADGQSKLSERMLGTVADRLIKTTSIPVLVYRTQESKAGKGIRTALAACDFSEESCGWRSAPLYACSRVEARPAKLVLFHTLALSINYMDFNAPMSEPRYWDEAERTAARQLEAIAAPLRSPQLQVETRTLRGYPADGLTEAQRLEPI